MPTTKPTPQTPLQQRWTTLYRTTLPSLAAARSPVQPTWPVHLDHCFARIILDNAVGVDVPWTEKVKAPATRNMGEGQLRRAVELGEKIARGEVGLVELDCRSLGLRGKVEKRGKGGEGRSGENGVGRGAGTEVVVKGPPGTKRKAGALGDTSIWQKWRCTADGGDSKRIKADTCLPTPETSPSATREEEATKEEKEHDNNPIPTTKPTPRAVAVTDDEEALTAIRARIATDSSLTPFRAHVLTLLTQVPRGRYTTYKALAAAIPLTVPPRPTSTSNLDLPPSSSTCARAVGSAMRNNPFAPLVPCHRVLAADGRIGGFGGDWGEEGRFVGEKRRLLREEGVWFDGRGRVVGEVFGGFV